MKTKCLLAFAASLIASTASALVMAPPPGPARVARVETIVLGRIIAQEDKDIEATIPGSPQKTKYRIAVLKVNESIRGAKEGELLRVAFMPPPVIEPGRPVIRTGGGGRINLDVGQDGMFMLTKHPDGFYQPPMFFNIVARTNPNFDKEVKDTRKLCKLLDDPIAGLKSTSAAERLQTASLMIYRYRNFLPGPTKQEPIDADESKLILKALTEADWKKQRVFGQTHPLELFQQLGLTPKDGWQMPAGAVTAEQLNQAALAWLREHAADYRIQKIVAGK